MNISPGCRLVNIQISSCDKNRFAKVLQYFRSNGLVVDSGWVPGLSSRQQTRSPWTVDRERQSLTGHGTTDWDYIWSGLLESASVCFSRGNLVPNICCNLDEDVVLILRFSRKQNKIGGNWIRCTPAHPKSSGSNIVLTIIPDKYNYN